MARKDFVGIGKGDKVFTPALAWRELDRARCLKRAVFVAIDGRKFPVARTRTVAVPGEPNQHNHKKVWVRHGGDRDVPLVSFTVILDGKDMRVQLGSDLEGITFRQFQVEKGPITGAWSLC